MKKQKESYIQKWIAYYANTTYSVIKEDENGKKIPVVDEVHGGQRYSAGKPVFEEEELHFTTEHSSSGGLGRGGYSRSYYLEYVNYPVKRDDGTTEIMNTPNYIRKKLQALAKARDIVTYEDHIKNFNPAQYAEMEKREKAVKVAVDEAVAAKDAEVAAKDAEIARLKKELGKK